MVLVRNLGGKTDFFKEKKKRHLDKSPILKLLEILVLFQI